MITLEIRSAPDRTRSTTSRTTVVLSPATFQSTNVAGSPRYPRAQPKTRALAGTTPRSRRQRLTSSLSIQYQTHSRTSSAVFLKEDWNQTNCVHPSTTFLASRLLFTSRKPEPASSAAISLHAASNRMRVGEAGMLRSYEGQHRGGLHNAGALCAPRVRRVLGVATPSSGLPARRRLVGFEGLLVLTPFGLRPDLDEHHHDGTGPQRPAERVEQVGQQRHRLGRRGVFEQEAADMSGQTHHDPEAEDPVEGPLPGSRATHDCQMLAHPGEHGVTFPPLKAERVVFGNTLGRGRVRSPVRAR